jgi:hypothetical protein
MAIYYWRARKDIPAMDPNNWTTGHVKTSWMKKMIHKIKRYITPYKIKRDHDNKTTFFFVNAPEVKQYGVGFQLNIKGTLYGLSIHSNKISTNGK